MLVHSSVFKASDISEYNCQLWCFINVADGLILVSVFLAWAESELVDGNSTDWSIYIMLSLSLENWLKSKLEEDIPEQN